MPGLPFVQEGMDVACWHAPIEFSHVTLHGTPDALNVVALAKDAFGVAVCFSTVAKPLHVAIAYTRIRDEMA